VLTLLIYDSRAGWTAQLLDSRTPNETEPKLPFSEIVSDPETGKTVLERELKEFLTDEGLPSQPIKWQEVEHVDLTASPNQPEK
jgi:hypothetical protein